MSKIFTDNDRSILANIMKHRRDVRGNHFTDKPLNDDVVQQILDVVQWSPSVGFSQPWEFLVIRDRNVRLEVAQNFEVENDKAVKQFDSSKQEQYQKFKLEGIVKAPVNIAVFYKQSQKAVLGQTSITEVGEYSVVCAIQNMWLMARAMNIGIGWVSIFDREKVEQILNAPSDRKLVAYLCVGYVDEFLDVPELEEAEWESRKSLNAVTYFDKFG